MKKFKSQKGITLIALIITIIVMLILVAVTVSVALNGGLFNNAKDAKVKTQKEADREELLSLVAGTLNNTGDLQINTTTLTKDGWTAETTENAKYLKCTSPKDIVLYVNIDTGKIEDSLPEPQGEDEIFVGKTYYMFDYEDDAMEVFTIADSETISYQVEMDNELVTDTIKFTYQAPQSSSVPGILTLENPLFGVFDFIEVYVSNGDAILRFCETGNDGHILVASGLNSSMSQLTGVYTAQETISNEEITHTIEFKVVAGNNLRIL